MIRRAASHRGGRADPGDHSALETDVVRFVAIVGLTFMVIFALVQSIPYEGTTTPEVEIAPHPPPAPEPAPPVATVPPVRASDVTSDLAAVATLEAASAAEDEHHRTEVGRLRDQVELLERELREATVAVDDAVVPEPAALGEIPDRLVLRFRDDRVYLELLKVGKIRSYLRIAALDLTYRVRREAPQRLGFSLVYDRGEGAVYEIPHTEVPLVLRDETRRFDLKLSLRNDLDYLVVLSDAIRDQVERLEARGEVGYYDILASERVVPAGHR